ncbi:MAG: hypothetical protein GY861_03145 [bacterium]|nr:hypothetical protein [bacterium]
MTDISDEQKLKDTEEARIKSQADEIASAKIQELQDKIGEAVGSKPDDEKYSSIGAMKEDIDRRAEEKAQKAKEEAVTEIREELKEKEEKAKRVEEDRIKQTKEDQQKEWSRVTNEWKEAVKDGIAPSIDDDLHAKLEKGTKYKDLTKEERSDPGLVFYNRARQEHVEAKREGRTTSFYRTITQMNKKPSSASAPVFGGSVATPPATHELTDSEVNKATNKALGMALPT